MGTWGTAIFSDDLACDIRDQYRQYLGDGLTGQQASDALLEEFRDDLADPDVAAVFWLALAATQWRCGRLEERVQFRALDIIESGADLKRWKESPDLFSKRKTVLQKLHSMLLSPQSPAKRIHKRFRNTCEWEIGEVIGYRLLSGAWALFRVIGHSVDRGGTRPIFEILDWTGDEIPPEQALKNIGIKSSDRGCAQGCALFTHITVGRVSKRELPQNRVLRTGIKLNPQQEVKHTQPYTLWRWLDRDLELLFDLR